MYLYLCCDTFLLLLLNCVYTLIFIYSFLRDVPAKKGEHLGQNIVVGATP